MSQRRTFTPEFKARVVLEVISGAKSAADIGRQHGLKPQLLADWKAPFLANAAKAFQSDEQRSQEQARIAELERRIGRLTLELEVSKSLQQLELTAEQKQAMVVKLVPQFPALPGVGHAAQLVLLSAERVGRRGTQTAIRAVAGAWPT